MPSTIQELLDRSRRELLDLSTRNRLLSIPLGWKSARIIRVLDERSEQVFRLLVKERRSMSFLPGRAGGGEESEILGEPHEDDEELGLPQPDDDEDPSTGLPKRHVDSRLQTTLSPEGLQRRLLDLFVDSATMLEEQGINALYLALGHLKWFDKDQVDTPRYAPLILVPVELQRRTAAERFSIRWREEDLEENLSLRTKLKADLGIELPPFPEGDDEIKISDYFAAVGRAVEGAKDWEVLPDGMTLGFFSFAKFLMYRDLDAENWPKSERLLDHPLITALLSGGFQGPEAPIPEDLRLDELLPISRLDHVVDADSSQTRAIEMVRQGRNLVIQGPPGTGKSQSIANIVASAVLDGKTVLFVAEKLAALEVVKRRLEGEGLGTLCLELHSNKAKKRDVLIEIQRTWNARPTIMEPEPLLTQLESRRAMLNRHVAILHQQLLPSELTPFILMGRVAALASRGRTPSEVRLDGAETWTKGQREERRATLEEAVQRVERIGLPSQHPWRGVRREHILNIDLDPLENQVRALVGKLRSLIAGSVELAAALALPVPTNMADIQRYLVVADFVANAPPLDKNALMNGVWSAGLSGLLDLVRSGREFSDAMLKAGTQVPGMVWSEDLAPAQERLLQHGGRWFSLLSSEYRRGVADLRRALAGQLPKKHAERLDLLGQLVAGQRALQQVRAGSALGRAAFGSLWQEERSDWEQLEAILNWVALHESAGLDATFHRIMAAVDDPRRVAALREQVETERALVGNMWDDLASQLNLDCMVSFGMPQIADVPLADLADRCAAWLSHLEDLVQWNNYFLVARRARELGMTQLVAAVESGELPHTSALDVFDRAYYTQLLRLTLRANPDLAQFDGSRHGDCAATFQKLDRERLTLAKHQVLAAHCSRLPPLGSAVGPVGILRGEMERKRGHRPVRKLLKDAGLAVQAIKPVFMMSPLSIAQFLQPGTLEFDLLVIDEASQVEPVDAFGAITRCHQLVVIGDSQQLPPSRFFQRVTGSDVEADDEAPEASQAKDIESILGLCRARGLPATMLEWHYRSRHQSLIAVSNQEFYQNRLVIVPSPYAAAAGLGLKFHHVPEGVFDSGGSGTNRIEANAICRAIVEHARSHPDLSLGVAAFSLRQRQAILEELELLRREEPEIERFFGAHSTEPFFIKNLENVQGDERDVIFISVGYGRDRHGAMAMRFGPLSNEGGERRLNVLISRAKVRCEVFSSITAEDIDLNRAKGRGVAALKAFLAFAQTGHMPTTEHLNRESGREFQESVRKWLESLGYSVHQRVGIARLFVDLAIVDKDNEGHYLLGIECDGASYAESSFARERDRLREEVLEARGWIMHRIWITDWLKQPKEEMQKLVAAIDRAKILTEEFDRREAPAVQVTVTAGSADGLGREVLLELGQHTLAPELAVEYSEARFEVPRSRDPHELPTRELAEIVLKVIQHEGPIHEDEARTRVRDLWGFGRAGSRIQDAVERAVRSLLVTKRCRREKGFLSIPDAPVRVRRRDSVSSPTLKKPEMLPPAEIRAAVLALVKGNLGAMPHEIPSVVARIFGFKATSAQLRSVIEFHTAALVREGILCNESGTLHPCSGRHRPL